MIRLLVFFAFFSSLPAVVSAQQQLPGNKNIYNAGARGIIYDRELDFTASLQSPRNIEIGVRSGKLISYDKMKFWSISLGNIRHSRERRINPEDFNPRTKRISRSFTLGKENQLYAVRVGFGKRKYWSEKARQKGVAIGYSYEFGPSLGVLKPYYLESKLGDGQFNTVDIRHTGENTERFLDQNSIFGASSFGTGLDEISFRPGFHARIATHFGFGAYDELSKYLEAGLLIDYFVGETNILIESDLTPGVTNPPAFLSLYVKMAFGKRW